MYSKATTFSYNTDTTLFTTHSASFTALKCVETHHEIRPTPALIEQRHLTPDRQFPLTFPTLSILCSLSRIWRG